MTEVDRPAPGRRILVVDDERSLRDVLRRYLTRRGWIVSEAGEAAQALALLHDPGMLIDAAVVDLHMPGLSGTELCRRIVTLRPLLATRLVVVSGDAVTAVEELARERLPCPVLAKPFELDELDAVLQDVMLL